MLRRLQLSPLPSTDATTASTDTNTGGGSRSTVDTVVGEESCDQLLRRLQLSPLPSTDATAASTDTGTRVAAVVLLSTLPSVRRSMSRLFRRLQLSPLPSTDKHRRLCHR